MQTQTPLIKAENLSKTFRLGKQQLCAVTDVSLAIDRQETLGIAGESGCGKSTLGRLLLRLEEPSAGSIAFHDVDITQKKGMELFHLRRQMQMIFQDPYTSLNPLMTVEEIISEGLKIHNIMPKRQRKEFIQQLLSQVALDPEMALRYPHEFSGGQRQRIGIARALAVNPAFIVCDEPLSALDSSTQQQVMELFLQLKKERSLSYLFISHDLNAIRLLADRVAIMYLGRLVEVAPTAKLFTSPQHPYTQALLAAIPSMDLSKAKKPSSLLLKGEPASPLNIPSGCPFHTRCPKAQPECRLTLPSMKEVSENHFARCHLITSKYTQLK